MGRRRKVEGEAAEKARKRAREWYLLHREDVLLRAKTTQKEDRAEAKRRYDQEHQEENQKHRQQRYWRDPEASRRKRRESYSQNSEREIEKTLRRRAENPERYREYMQEWRGKNLESRAKYRKSYNFENKERISSYRKIYYRRDPERFKGYEARKRARHRNKINAYKRKWANEAYQKDPIKQSAGGRRRRARLANAGGIHTAQEIHALWEQQGHKCAVPECQYPITAQRGKNKYHIDHIMPVILGGSDDISNIQLLCCFHNHQKGAMHPDKWAQKIGRHS